MIINDFSIFYGPLHTDSGRGKLLPRPHIDPNLPSQIWISYFKEFETPLQRFLSQIWVYSVTQVFLGIRCKARLLRALFVQLLQVGSCSLDTIVSHTPV